MTEAGEYSNCVSAEGYDAPLYEYPVYDIKQSDGKAPVMLEFGGMWSNPSLPLLPGQLWPGLVAPARVIYGSNKTAWHLNWV